LSTCLQVQDPMGDPVQVSVLMATFNAGVTVKAAIDSVLAQTGVKVELLIADGKSSDDTVKICAAYGARLAYFVSERDSGVYDAWNKLVPHARGEWLCVLGADDVFFDPSSLAGLLRAAQNRPAECRIVYGRLKLVDGSGHVMEELGAPWPELAATMRWRMCIPHGGTLHHRDVFRDLGNFNAAYRIAGDYALIRQETLARGAYFAADVVAVRAGWGGMSTRPEFEWRAHREVGQILWRADRRVPWVWWIRAAKIALRMAIYRVSGSNGLARYEQFKLALGLQPGRT